MKQHPVTSDEEQGSQKPEFSVAELQKFQEVRLNSVINRMANQRDEAQNKLAWAEAELQVQNAQITLLTNRLSQARVLLANNALVITELQEQLKNARVSEELTRGLVIESLKSHNTPDGSYSDIEEKDTDLDITEKGITPSKFVGSSTVVEVTE